jgi:alkylation response protein AidB-like acyl-CoA dehydrogenase
MAPSTVAASSRAVGLPRDLFEGEHVLFRESVATFVERHVVPRRETWRREHRIDRDAWLEAGRQGFLGLGCPEQHGGSGANDFRFNAVLSEELAAASLAVASCFGIQTDVVMPYLTELSTSEQRDRWLPAVCSGETITAIAMTEPGAGSDLAGIRSRARRDGADWVLDGSKTFITNGGSADLVVVAARTGPGRRDITLFGVEADTQGFTRGKRLEKVGQAESDTAELFFEDLRLPSANVLGAVDGGFAAMMVRLAQERLHTACVNQAHALCQLGLTIGYAQERRAFGRSIGSFQHSRFLLAELATKLDVTQAFVDHCVNRHVAGKLTPVDAAKVKWWTADVQNEVVDACVQLHGGYGYMEEYEVARAWTDARVTKIWAGTNELMKEVIGRDLGLGDPR